MTTTGTNKFRLKSYSENKLRYFTLYETEHRFYLVGRDIAKKHYKLLKIEKSDAQENNHEQKLNIYEDMAVYSCTQMNNLLSMIKNSNLPNANTKNQDANSTKSNIGFVTRVQTAYGLVGFIKFTLGYYMILITEKRLVGNIAGHFIYEIGKTELIPLFKAPIIQKKSKSFIQSRFALVKNEEERYKEIFLGLDLSKNFYFSYTYDLASTLQYNMTPVNKMESVPQETMFEWNSFLLKPFVEQVQDSTWLLPLIHGYFNHKKLSIFGKIIDIVLIGRRSRYFAGTRYLKRGISDNGYVANHVETEQIVYDSSSLRNLQSEGKFSSHIQTRGSIPLYWTQTIVKKVVDPKPEIVIGKFDPLYNASAKHFDNLIERYGSPVSCLDLVKRKEKKAREQLLGTAYAECVTYLNQILPTEKKLKYIPWDFKSATKESLEKALNALASFAEESLRDTDFFCSESAIHKNGYLLQNGVLRTNCIDCLDRTNIAQFFVGKYALGQQLYALGITDAPHLVDYSNIIKELMDLYDSLGDNIALQYGGSRTVSAGINRRGYSWDLMTSLKRYYSNNFKDETKQHAMNLFLGNYVPNSQQYMPPIWDLGVDPYLHDNGNPGTLQLLRDQTEITDSEQQYHQFFEVVYEDSKVTRFDVSSLQSIKNIHLENWKQKQQVINHTKFLIERRTSEEQTETDQVSTDKTNSPDGDSSSDTASITSTYLLSKNENQDERIRFYENKMQKISIINSNSICNDSFLANHAANMLRYQLEEAKLMKIMKHDQIDIDLFQEYVNKENFIYWEKDIAKQELSEYIHGTDPSSNKLLTNTNVYEDYMKQFSSRNNVCMSEPIPKDTSLYRDYLLSVGSIHSVSQEKEQSQILVGDNINELSMKQSQLESYSFHCQHYHKLYSFFKSLKNDHEQISKRVLAIASKMKEDLIIFDRVRHSHPERKLFSQVSFFELIKGKLYKKCFMGSNAIDWVLNNNGNELYIEKRIGNREEAKDFLQILLEANIIHHIAFARYFIDGPNLYKFSSDDRYRILNLHQPQLRESRRAVVISLEALSKITQIYQEVFRVGQRPLELKCKNFFNTLKEQSGTSIITSPLYKQFLDVAFELQRVDLQMPRSESICFFLNVYNTLMLHGLLVLCRLSGYGLHGLATCSFFQRTCYQIAGYKFSLSDIRDGILRNNKPYPGSFVSVFDSSYGTSVDPRRRFCINPEDLRVLFLLHKVDSIWNMEGSIQIPNDNPSAIKYNEYLLATRKGTQKYAGGVQNRFDNIFSCVCPDTIEAVLKQHSNVTS